MGAQYRTGAVEATLLFELLAGRRSVRRYLPERVPEETVEVLLQAAVTAPSAHNRQPWRFLVITRDQAKARLARAMGERLRADRTRDGSSSQDIEADIARSYARITGAPLLILVCLTMADMDRYPDESRARAEYLMAVQGTAMAAQNLLVAAHAAGLGACWMCAPLFAPDAAAAALDLPRDWEPQALVTFGYPGAAPKPFVRHAPREVTRYLSEEG
jgi:F420 biosynthesis protein FbiB-like protein